MSPSATKTCPRCAEDVRSAALVCRYCGYEFGGRHPQQWRARFSVGPVTWVFLAAFIIATAIPDIGAWVMVAVVLIVSGYLFWMSRRAH